ncbi:uncharacterized protein RSE6_05094 [Rhynchosporium secalis]|uniref:Uncharacterized protein n=1 Tax=Rhynchosporium secalis TaxID=38038 RepID=A0A1E1M6X9_RHYSE|nr:uncharacterized protein RSE6_05094 [Rhynchosporium secalis]
MSSIQPTLGTSAAETSPAVFGPGSRGWTMEYAIQERCRNLGIQRSNLPSAQRWVEYWYPSVNKLTGKVKDNANLALPRLQDDIRRTTEALGRMSVQDPRSYGGNYSPKVTTSSFPNLLRISHQTLIQILLLWLSVASLKLRLLPVEMGGCSATSWPFGTFLAARPLIRHDELHCLDIENLLGEYDRYVHGTPYKTRKIVLDAKIHDHMKGSSSPLTSVPVKKLHKKFRETLVAKIRVERKEKNPKPLLIIMCCHGSGDTIADVLGDQNFTGSEMITLMENNDGKVPISITLINTACYSERWLGNQATRKGNKKTGEAGLTGIAAASTSLASGSWTRSVSGKQLGGGMSISAIVQSLVQNSGRDTDQPLDVYDSDAGYPEKTLETYTSLAWKVAHRLSSELDRSASRYQIRFSATNDAYGDPWVERTGFPLKELEKGWMKLEDYPKDPWLHPGCWLNPDPTVTQSDREEWEDYVTKYESYLKQFPQSDEMKNPNKEKMDGTGAVLLSRKRTFGSVQGEDFQSLKESVSRLREIYEQGHTDGETSGQNTYLYGLLTEFDFGMIGSEAQSLKNLKEVYAILEYRLESLNCADRYVEALGVSMPPGMQSSVWKGPGNTLKDDEKDARHEEIQDLCAPYRKVLFPFPVGLAIHNSFGKGFKYMSPKAEPLRIRALSEVKTPRLSSPLSGNTPPIGSPSKSERSGNMSGPRTPAMHAANTAGGFSSSPLSGGLSNQVPPPRMGDSHRRVASQGSFTPAVHAPNTAGGFSSSPLSGGLSDRVPPPRMGDRHRRVVSQGNLPMQGNTNISTLQRQSSGGQIQNIARGGGSSGGSGQHGMSQGGGQDNTGLGSMGSPLPCRGRGRGRGRGNGQQ